jgi:rSAM/selenodomain-associated transferase 2
MISIIIPAYQEQENIGKTVAYLRQAAPTDHLAEIIVVDGGSQDATLLAAANAGAKAFTSPQKGRAAQMNAGAAIATGEILYFLHADSLPPPSFATDIVQAIMQGYVAGCYRLRFDHEHWFLRANAWFTRFNVNAIRFGDQSLFVQRGIFNKTGGFKEHLVVMEDQEIIGRIRRQGRFKVMNGYCTTSARKYLENGLYRMQIIFFIIWLKYYLGYSQQHLVATYRRLIKQHKV